VKGTGVSSACMVKQPFSAFRTIVAGLPEEARRRLLAVIPMGRMGTAEEVAALVVFLAGPQAGFITGQTIVVDGGVMIPASAATDTVPSAGTLPGSA